MTRGRRPFNCPAPGGSGQARLPTPKLLREGPDAGLEGRLAGVLDPRCGLTAGREGPDAELEGRLAGVLGSGRGLTAGREGPGAGLEGRLTGVLGLRRGPMAGREGPGSVASPKPSGFYSKTERESKQTP